MMYVIGSRHAATGPAKSSTGTSDPGTAAKHLLREWGELFPGSGGCVFAAAVDSSGVRTLLKIEDVYTPGSAGAGDAPVTVRVSGLLAELLGELIPLWLIPGDAIASPKMWAGLLLCSGYGELNSRNAGECISDGANDNRRERGEIRTVRRDGLPVSEAEIRDGHWTGF